MGVLCSSQRWWNLIGEGHLCKFKMHGHLDMSLNELVLDPRRGYNMILMPCSVFQIMMFHSDFNAVLCVSDNDVFHSDFNAVLCVSDNDVFHSDFNAVLCVSDNDVFHSDFNAVLCFR